jgi:hypothetical protein
VLSAVATEFKGRIEVAVKRLASSRVEGERARIALPILYPSGAGSAVEVVLSDDKCFVSDIGLGFTEAEMYGASDFYTPSAQKAVERFGVGFDGLGIFVVQAPLDRIEGAVAAVANASVNAANGAIYKAMEEKEKKKNTDLFEKVCRVFGSTHVRKYEEIRGRDAVWPAHNVVLIRGHKSIFEYVNDNPTSIASKFIMFSDLSRIGDELSLNSVVNSVESIGPKGKMLADVSNVIPFASSDHEYRRYARAA